MTDPTGFLEDVDDDNGTQLDFGADPSICTALDGAWWPRTRDSATELAGLVAALRAKNVAVELITLNPQGWRGHPRRIDVADRAVRIEWAPSLDLAILTGTTDLGRRIDLLLVVPEADQNEPGAEPMSQHAALRASMSTTERALAMATLDGGSQGAWIAGVRTALAMLRADLLAYQGFAAGPTGIHRQILADTPRLSHAVAELGRQQGDIGQLLDRTLACVAEPATETRSDHIRAQSLALLRRLRRYQHDDAELRHEADQDVGGQG